MEYVKTWEVYITQQPVLSKWSRDNVTKPCTDKDPFKVQQRPTDFNVTEKEKFTDVFSDFTEQLNFKNCHLSNFNVASEKNIHDYLKSLCVCEGGFFHVLQPEQCLEID